MAALRIKDTPIEMAFKQVGRAVNQESGGQQTPWTSSSFLDDFYFNPSAAGVQEASVPTTMPPQPVSDSSSDYLKKGEDYYLGRGVPKDYEEAAKWYRKAAELGNSTGQFELARMYMNGHGVTRDYAEAAKWLRKSADQEYANAQCGLGLMYLDGRGITKDIEEGAKWIIKSAYQGDANAQGSLGTMYFDGVGVSKDYREAFGWYRKSANREIH